MTVGLTIVGTVFYTVADVTVTGTVFQTVADVAVAKLPTWQLLMYPYIWQLLMKLSLKPSFEQLLIQLSQKLSV